MKTYNKRPIYLEKIRSFIDTEMIKVLIGQRRVGKSYILYQIMDELIQNYNIQDEQIIYINKELEEFSFLVDYKDLLKYIKKDKKSDHSYGKTHLFP